MKIVKQPKYFYYFNKNDINEDIFRIQHWIYSHVAFGGVSSKQQCFIRIPLHWQTALMVTTLQCNNV